MSVPSDMDSEAAAEAEEWREKYKAALIAVESHIPGNVRKILLAHAVSDEARLSVAEMGDVVGYKGARAASLQYGIFARMLSEQMGALAPGANQLSAIGAWDASKNAMGHGGWVMYNELIDALQELGWLADGSSDFDAVAGTSARQTSALRETEVRVGQDQFRAMLLEYWGGCSVTGCSFERVLTASHIVRWEHSDDFERLDPFNGLLLTPGLDSLFDQHLISFDRDGRIQISSLIDAQTLKFLAVDSNMRLRKIEVGHLPYLGLHLQRFLELQSC